MIYETSFLFLPILADDELAKQVGVVKEAITSLGGEIVSEEYPQSISLAYPIRHRLENKYSTYETAHFGWVKYELPADKAAELKKKLDEIKLMLRYLTLKTVKEVTYVAKDVFATLQGGPSAPVREKKDFVKEAKKATEEEGTMDEKEVDEGIDKLVEETEVEAESDEAPKEEKEA